MYLLIVFALFGTIWRVGSEVHSLSYIYTALSRPVDLPGVHEFTAMGMLDGKIIDYYDSQYRKKVPKQDWMRERMDEDYWRKGTRSRESKEEWFKVNIGILMARLQQNKTEPQVHVLQWMHGCEVKDDVFSGATDSYSYDGEDFLSFNNKDKVWIAPTPEGRSTKDKWDNVQALNDYTRNYLNKECVEWLNKFHTYGKDQLVKAKPPKIYMSKKTSLHGENFILTCFATGFYPKDIVMNIWRNGRKLDAADGVTSTGVRPNEDDTFQLKKQVEILKDDESQYKCEVVHAESNVHILHDEWKLINDGNGAPIGIIAGAVVALLLVLVGAAVAGVFVYRKKNKKVPSKSSDSSSNEFGEGSKELIANGGKGSADRISKSGGETDSLMGSNSSSNESGKGSDEHIDNGAQQ